MRNRDVRDANDKSRNNKTLKRNWEKLRSMSREENFDSTVVEMKQSHCHASSAEVILTANSHRLSRGRGGPSTLIVHVIRRPRCDRKLPGKRYI